MNANFKKVEAELTQLMQNNIRLKNEIEELALSTERKIDAMVLELIQVIDAYEKADKKTEVPKPANSRNQRKK